MICGYLYIYICIYVHTYIYIYIYIQGALRKCYAFDYPAVVSIYKKGQDMIYRCV